MDLSTSKSCSRIHPSQYHLRRKFHDKNPGLHFISVTAVSSASLQRKRVKNSRACSRLPGMSLMLERRPPLRAVETAQEGQIFAISCGKTRENMMA